jgi:prepilin-type N-terminal cleavage/methylation domain-containing protein/prepilin-type processing-associated H-X9-DG protein
MTVTRTGRSNGFGQVRETIPMKNSFTNRFRNQGMSLVELLVVIVIIATLVSLLVPGLSKAKELAEAMKSTSNLKEIAVSTLNWAAENNSKIPSPQYPGGMQPPPGINAENFFPRHYNLGESGLWLDGVVFAQIYLTENPETGEVATTYNVTQDGEHLKGTFFESSRSVKKDPLEKNWHRHSYAMNANLQYDRIYDQVQSPDPWLTEKTLSNLVFAPRAMLYIDNIESNVVRFENRQQIIDTIEKRWDGGKVIAAFLDGHAERLSEADIPAGNPIADREASRFWRGVDAAD